MRSLPTPDMPQRRTLPPLRWSSRMLQPYRYLLSQDLSRQSYGEGYFDYTHTQWPRMGKAELFYSPESSADEQDRRFGILLGPPDDGIRSRHKALVSTDEEAYDKYMESLT